MSVMRIEQWLSSLGFKQYTQLFIDNGYDDFELCKQLRENDLDLMGITIPIVKGEILSSVNSLKHAENAPHVYFSMDPNYWQTDGSINSASTFKSCLQEQKVSVAIQESDDSADVYKIVLSELANDGVTPAMLLTFPVTLKAKSGERTPDKTSDSGNDSDLEEIYCAQVLASIYEERLKIPQDKILNVLHCIQRVHCKRIESRNIDLKIANSASNQFTSRRRTPKLQQRMSSFDCSTGGSEHNQLEADPRYSNVPIASKTLGRMHSYQKPKNIVSCITSTLSGSQSNINSGDFWLEGTADFSNRN